MSPLDIQTRALAAFDHVVNSPVGFRAREGQRHMAELVAQTFSTPTLGKCEEEPERAFAVIEAGTGVGKSIAYAAPAIAAALARKTRVIISTATVALQEQLVHKDLPLLSTLMPEPFTHALAKGRGRYVCKYKLQRWVNGEAEPDLFADEMPTQGSTGAGGQSGAVGSGRAPTEYQLLFYRQMATELKEHRWNGDRDTLAVPPTPEMWRPVAAEASSCTAKHCPDYQDCTYFDQRKALAASQVIVANHDLLLATINGNTLPDLSDCLLVLDEGHHLPSVALNHFQESTDLTRLRWVEQLALRARKTAEMLDLDCAVELGGQGSALKQHLQEAAQQALALYRPRGLTEEPVELLPIGPLPAMLSQPVSEVLTLSAALLKNLQNISNALRTQMKERPEDARELSTHYVQLGVLAPKLEAVQSWAALMLLESEVPAARWFTFGQYGEFMSITASASPIQPASALRHKLWGKARAVVITSATLTSCGNFDFFLNETGLRGLDNVSTRVVSSPFDFARQGHLVAVETQADPKRAADFNQAMCKELMSDLAQVQAGALVLFTSRDQMRTAVDSLSGSLRHRVVVQNDLPRQTLLQRHRDRVERGEASIIFGMQSFGEGLDLPGALCESVFICKLPFAPPSDPVSSARSQWLRSKGRDPFMELVVPAVSIRLAQWVGRAIRSETDQAHVYCYDRRLIQTSFGQRLLAGLPPFKRQRRNPQGQVFDL
ncbi:ATP-dependent DNA helicase DinG [Curvibacter sp. RS43]|uniref:ATP-dependent DNA helicase DinG n=1 Tax=Curvibacter microcysteis TaxID=3026419 RepID=UPI0023613F6D|nr:ATP-dependent DNA helicase DinG [Curvibacter sp. RS43]MDD0810016.1 ATP-dependent DNA helicase DinG [Curvibacter sp. RS43]